MHDGPLSQAEFGALVGITQQAVSDLLQAGVLRPGGSAREWLLAYCARLREQAAGRMGSTVGGLDLPHERAALAREQRRGLELKNAVLRGDYAAVSLLTDVLATASQAVAARLEHLPGALKKQCPEMTDEQRAAAITVINAARAEWLRSTAALVAQRIELDPADDDLDAEPELPGLADDIAHPAA